MAQPSDDYVAELERRVGASEQVQRDYLAQIQDIRGELKKAQAEARQAANWKYERDEFKEELDLYRALVQGWPAGQRLVTRLTRVRDDDDDDY